MDSTSFVTELTKLGFENVFNPYTDICSEHDADNAPAIRRRNLELVLEAALARGVDSIWIGRDLGYNGGRRTGLALTDEANLPAHAGLYGGLSLRRATRGPEVAELTAKIVWQALRELNRPIFLWNVFPLHPLKHDNPMSNRCHTRQERRDCRRYLEWLLEQLRPQRIVAIGGDAYHALAEMKVEATRIRHPSHGGTRKFLDGVGELYGVSQLRHKIIGDPS